MTLRKKIVLSNIMMVFMPIVLLVIIWGGYLHFGSGNDFRQISRASEGGDLLTEAMNILYTCEAELSGMNWDVVELPGENGTDIIVSPEKERISELGSLGYHIQIETEKGISYSNMDDSDREVLREAGTGSEGAVIWSGSRLIIQDSFYIAGRNYYLTAVYNGQRADKGAAASLLPMYMVSPTLLVLFFVTAALSIVLTSFLAARWMNKSILIPLDELKTGADKIAGGDLDYRISYPGQDEFGDVCEEFDRMRIQLKEAGEKQRRYEEERRELLRGISHDLRSPLTSIKGYAQGLRDGIANTDEKRRRYCDAILTRADDLERLTGSLSLLVKLENDGSLLRPEKVCLDEYIRQFLSEKEAWIAEQKIDVRYLTDCGDAEVRIDIREMQRVLMNLLENTVRYRKTDRSRVELTVSKRTRNIEIRFADDGPGVSSRHLKHLFDSFYRADESRTNPEKGSGLGLAVVKRIIEGLEGSVYAVSERGLCIVILLPRVKEEQENEKNSDC